MRLGDLDALKEDLKQYFSDGTLDSVSAKLAFNIILRKIDNAPPVTPPAKVRTPKPGHWVEEKINAGSRKVFCSECGCPPPFEYVSTGDVYSASGYGVINKTNFCPNCGADMKKGGKE